MAGILFPGFPGRLESRMTVTPLFIDMAGNTPFLSSVYDFITQPTETLIFPQFLIFRADFRLIQSGVSIVCLLSINRIQESESSQKNYDCSLFNHMDKMKGICEEK